jgi:hypothetical protein
MAMRRAEPTLKIDFLARGYPVCSLCGMRFGTEGMTRSLIDAFALHVRRQHLDANQSSPVPPQPRHHYSLRTARRMWRAGSKI